MLDLYCLSLKLETKLYFSVLDLHTVVSEKQLLDGDSVADVCFMLVLCCININIVVYVHFRSGRLLMLVV